MISYSIDNGNTWTEGNSASLTRGNSAIWKGEMTAGEFYGSGEFSSTCNFEVKGNVMSLLYGDNFEGQLSIEGKNACFCNLFSGATKLISAENLILPPTTLAEGCYDSMFNGCTSLTSAPQLPATTLAEYCYNYMFGGCTSLTSAPELLAITLAEYCYEIMFEGCTSLNYIKAMFTTTPSLTYTNNWVNGVSANGTFVKNSAATWNPEEVRGVNGVPTNWTVETASE